MYFGIRSLRHLFLEDYPIPQLIGFGHLVLPYRPHEHFPIALQNFVDQSDKLLAGQTQLEQTVVTFQLVGCDTHIESSTHLDASVRLRNHHGRRASEPRFGEFLAKLLNRGW